MRILDINIQETILQTIEKGLKKNNFKIDSEEYYEIVICGEYKLQKVTDEDSEYYIWASLEDSNETSHKYDDALSAIAEKVVEGEAIVGFDSFLDFCKWYIEQQGAE
jgi:hypothetical protein